MRGPVARALAVFWGAAVLLLGSGALVLQLLGPPAADGKAKEAAAAAGPGAAATTDGHGAPEAAPAGKTAATAGDHGAKAPGTHDAPAASAPKAVPVAPAPKAAPVVVVAAKPGAPIVGPDAALLEPAPLYEGARLPKVAADGRMAMRVYAAGRDPDEIRPRIAVLLSDFGMNEQDSDEAVRALPAAVSFAVSPYSARSERLLGAARARGHELFAALPMEPQNHPLRDAGTYALLTGNPPAVNALRLEWALSRFAGYVGVTGALGPLHGERFAASSELFATMLEELGRRGLLYVDPRPGVGAPKTERMPPFRGIDVVVDTPPVRAEVEAKLERLEQVAREKGVAIGLVNSTLPMVVDRVGAWAVALQARGIALVPVSAIVLPGEGSK